MRAASVIREAAASETAILLEIARAAQTKLAGDGSTQKIAGYSDRNLTERITRGEAFVLEVSGSIIGSAFVEPVTPDRFPQIVDWNAVPDGCSAWFLYGLVIHPEHQGQMWGRALLQGICRRKKLAAQAVLLLDCWAGNDKLRRFYAGTGFVLHGVFPEKEYQIAVFCMTL